MIELQQTVLRIIRYQWTKHSIYKAESCFWETILCKYFIFVHSPGPLNEGIHSQVKSVCTKRHSRIVKLRELSLSGDGSKDRDLSLPSPESAYVAE